MKEKLFERDWQFMLDSVYRINTMTNVNLFEREALECLCVLIPCTQGTFFVAEPEGEGRHRFVRPVVVGQEARFMDEFMTGTYDHDPYFGGMGLLPQTRTFKDSDLMPESYRVTTKLYKDIYEKQGIHYALRSYLVHNGRLVGNISLFNSKEQGDFDDKSVVILNAMAPHIAMKLGALLDAEDPVEEETHHAYNDALFSKYSLTPRERNIVSLVVSGVSDHEIAETLCISTSTFKKHLYNVYKKLHVNNRVQLFSLAHSLSSREGEAAKRRIPPPRS